VPETGSICESSNYIKVQSVEELYVTLSIEEADINTVKAGLEAEITITATNKTYTGKIDKISDVGSYSSSGSTFTASVKFSNDDEVKLRNVSKLYSNIRKSRKCSCCSKRSNTNI
jgi:hypothetical protein